MSSPLSIAAVARASLFHVLWQAVSTRGIALEPAVEVSDLDEGTGGATLLDAAGRRFGPFDLVVDASGARSSDSVLAALLRDFCFGPMAKLPWLRHDMIRTLAGLKTGPFSAQPAEVLAGLTRLSATAAPAEVQA